METYLYQPASVQLDNFGNGTCRVSPPVGQYWHPTLVKVSTVLQGSTTRPYCAVYQGANGVLSGNTFVDDTQQGDNDTTSMVSGTVTQYGEAITAKWTGGNPGDTATLVVLGVSTDVPPSSGSNSQPSVPGAHFSGHATAASTQLANVVAQAVSTAGVPAIDHPAAVAIVFNTSIAAGATYTSARLNFAPYQSVVGTIYAQETTGGGLGVNPYIRMTFDWSLQSDNYDPLRREDWVGAIGPLSFVSNYRHDWASRCYGDTLTFTVVNEDSKAIILTYGFFGSYRPNTRSELRSRYPDDYSAESTGLGSDDILLGAHGLNVPANTAIDVGVPVQLWEGPAQISATYTAVGNTVPVNTVFARLVPEPNSILGITIDSYNDQPNFMTVKSLTLPRRTCRMEVHNGNAFAITASVVMFGQVQPS